MLLLMAVAADLQTMSARPLALQYSSKALATDAGLVTPSTSEGKICMDWTQSSHFLHGSMTQAPRGWQLSVPFVLSQLQSFLLSPVLQVNPVAQSLVAKQVSTGLYPARAMPEGRLPLDNPSRVHRSCNTPAT